MRISSNKQDDKDATFAKNTLPSVVDESQLRKAVQDLLETVELGPSIKKPKLRGLHRLSIRDERPVDGPLTEVYVDAVKDLMFVKVTGSGFGGPGTVGPTWYGPLHIKHPATS